jgi:outer membrane protein W
MNYFSFIFKRNLGKSRFVVLYLIMITGAIVLAPSKIQAQKPQPLPAEEVEKLIQQLGDENWEIREQATNALIEEGKKFSNNVLPKVRQAKYNTDPEIQFRAQYIVQMIMQSTNDFVKGLRDLITGLFDGLTASEEDWALPLQKLDQFIMAVAACNKEEAEEALDEFITALRNMGGLANEVATNILNKLMADDDKDNMPYWWEMKWGLNPGLDDSKNDPDQDGVTNDDEYKRGTNPNDKDTDGDNKNDKDDPEPLEYAYVPNPEHTKFTVSANAGAFIPADPDVKDFYGSGFTFGAGLEYFFTPKISLSGDLDYWKKSKDEQMVGIEITNSLRNMPLTFSGVYHISLTNHQISPYIGVGTGIDFVRKVVEMSYPDPHTGDMVTTKNHESEIGWDILGKAGVDYYFNPHWAVNLEANYSYVPVNTWDLNVGGLTITAGIKFGILTFVPTQNMPKAGFAASLWIDDIRVTADRIDIGGSAITRDGTIKSLSVKAVVLGDRNGPISQAVPIANANTQGVGTAHATYSGSVDLSAVLGSGVVSGDSIAMTITAECTNGETAEYVVTYKWP